MKLSSILLPITLIGTASATCINNEIKEVIPGYKVKITCDSRVKGTLNSAATQEACAQLCKTANAPHCSYKASTKQCLVATVDGVPQTSVGAVLMSKVQDDDGDDFPEPTDAEKLADCQAELATYKDKEWKCKDYNCFRSEVIELIMSIGPENHQKDIPLGDNTFRLWCHQGKNIIITRVEETHLTKDEYSTR